jgi:hypothetical protein
VRKPPLCLCCFACATFIALICAGYLLESHLDLSSYVITPRLYSPRAVDFSCVNSSALVNDMTRRVVLHGPDWTLKLAVEPTCLPERDLVFSSEFPRLLLSKSVERRTHLWVNHKDSAIFVRIVESSGAEEQDMIAVGLVTDHRCAKRSSKNCNIKGGLVAFPID